MGCSSLEDVGTPVRFMLPLLQPPSEPGSARAGSAAGVGERQGAPPPGASSLQHVQQQQPPARLSTQQEQQTKPNAAAAPGISPAVDWQQSREQFQQQQQRPPRVERSHSVPAEHPGKVDIFAEDQRPFAFRPASVNSAYGNQYFGSKAAGGQVTPQMAYHTQGGAAAHNRLYADYFTKQDRLNEERRLRWVALCWYLSDGPPPVPGGQPVVNKSG